MADGLFQIPLLPDRASASAANSAAAQSLSVTVAATSASPCVSSVACTDASLPAINTSAGWRPHTDQVGQTGTKISPEIYIACGISGATQHMAGCKGAKKLLAINEDGEASIFASADYAVIGDLHEILPAISAEIRKAKGT